MLHTHTHARTASHRSGLCYQDVVETIKESCATIPICCSPASELSTFRLENIKIRIHRNVAQRPMTTRTTSIFAIHCRARIEYRWCLLQHLFIIISRLFLFFSCHRFDARCGPSASVFLHSIDFSLFPNAKNGNPNQTTRKKLPVLLWPRRVGEKKFGVFARSSSPPRRKKIVRWEMRVSRQKKNKTL